jgi:Subtilase family/Carboxypeptidase regulatory-like domain
VIVTLFCTIAFFSLANLDSAIAANDSSNKIENQLLDQYTVGSPADFIVRFTERADLSPAYSMDWETRGEYVYNTLREAADHSQAAAKAILDAQGLTYKTLIAGNDLYVFAGSQTANQGLTALNKLAALQEVSFIRATRTYSIDPVEQVNALQGISWAGDLLASHALTTVGSSVDAITDWGITDTKAPLFWSTFGVQGDGILVANIDTGVQWNHPALDQSYKCSGNPSNPACWSDPSNICGGSPCDNNGHGTHTMGTMVADDDSSLTYIAGMAPNAQWIACKGCESGSCSDFALESCADWILAPGGNSANRPEVVNNSWGGGGDDPWYQSYVQAWVAAGIFPAFSAGNAGSGCSTLGSPGDYQESFASAAHNSSRSIASFSSRGPSLVFGHDPYTKPNISAPGVAICSSYPTNSWSCGYSGTSMASPHSAGAVALLWSCNPNLIGQVDATFQILQDYADIAPDGTCGAPPDGQGNYTFGYGYLDINNAGTAACGDVNLGTFEGYVYNSTGAPIQGANVSVDPSILSDNIQSLTDPSGHFSMELLPGTYTATAQKSGYLPDSISGIEISEGGTTTATFTLDFVGQTYLPLVMEPYGSSMVNGDFEQGHVGWTEYSFQGYPIILPGSGLPIAPYDGTWAAWLGGAIDEISYVQQQILVPASNPFLYYWHWIASEDYCGYDYGMLLINDVVKDEYSLCFNNDTNGWVKKVVDLSSYAGQSVSLQIKAECDNYLNSNLFIDHVSFQSSLTAENSPPESSLVPNANIPKPEETKK